VIAAVDGRPVNTVEELNTAFRKKKPGDEVELTIRRLKRDGKTWEEKKMKVKLAEDPN